MKTVTQKARFRQSVINYAEKHGVTRSANRYDVTRQYIYRGKKDMMVRSTYLWTNHAEQELKLIFNMKRRNPHTGLVDKTSVKRVYSVGNKLVSYSDKN